MKYRSRTGFGDVNWPWWHDVLTILVMCAVMYYVGR